MDGVLKPFARSYYQSSNPVLKTVIKVNLCDGKAKQKAMKTVAAVSGVDFIAIDMNEKLLTVIGTVNPLTVVKKLRKYWHADIATAGAPVEAPAWDIVNGYYPPAASNHPYKPVSYYPYNHVPHYPYAHVSNYPSYPTYYNPVVSMEENPNACVIC